LLIAGNHKPSIASPGLKAGRGLKHVPHDSDVHERAPLRPASKPGAD